MAKGQKFLKVTGILMIIGGALATIITIGLLVVVLAISQDASFEVMDVVATIVGLAGCVVELIAGIVGVKNAAKPEKAGVCICMGAIVIVLTILGLILGGEFSVSTVLSFVIPVLYIIGALMNKKQAEQQNTEA